MVGVLVPRVAMGILWSRLDAEFIETSMARQGINQLPSITQLASHYDLCVFEMDSCGTTLNIQSIPLPSPSDKDVVPDVTDNGDDNDNDNDDDNVKLDRDNENISSTTITNETNSLSV